MLVECPVEFGEDVRGCAPRLVSRPQDAVGERVAHRPPAEVVAVVRTGVFVAFFGERQGSDLEARVGGGQGLGPIDIGSTMLLHLVPPARFPVLIGADAVILEALLHRPLVLALGLECVQLVKDFLAQSQMRVGHAHSGGLPKREAAAWWPVGGHELAGAAVAAHAGFHMVAASSVVGVVVDGDGHSVQWHAAPPIVEAVGGPFEALAAFLVASIVRVEPAERAGDLRVVGAQFADLVQGGEGIVEQVAVAKVRVLSQSLAGFAVEGQGQTAVGFEVVRHGGGDAVEGFAGFGPLALL